MTKMNKKKLYNYAFYLSLFTIFYNIIEGIVSIYFGIEDDSLTLFGFGADSFIEALSGLGIAHMVMRIKKNQHVVSDKFEITALKITGVSFYLLSAGLAIGIVSRLVNHQAPSTTIPGVIISCISIIIMLILVKMKVKIGKGLNSQPILADAGCTRICIYMSLVLLVSSLIYELTKIDYIDILGTLGIIYFSIKEGKEAFDKAKGIHHCHCDHDH